MEYIITIDTTITTPFTNINDIYPTNIDIAIIFIVNAILTDSFSNNYSTIEIIINLVVIVVMLAVSVIHHYHHQLYHHHKLKFL